MSGFAQALLGSGGGSGALDRFIQRKATPVIPVPEAVVGSARGGVRVPSERRPFLPIQPSSFRLRHAVRTSPLAGDLTTQTPTTSRLSIGKAFACYLLLFSARAVAEPIKLWSATAVRPAANYRQTAKSTTRKISGFHAYNITWFMYAGGVH